jgi:HEAT repeat protein
VIAAALGKGTQPEQRAVFDAHLRLAEAMRDAGRAAQARNVYVHALQTAAGPAQRCAALLGVGAVGTAADVAAVLPFVADADPLVRHSAAQCLAGMQDEKTGAALADAMKASPPPVRAAVLRVLALRKDVGPIEAATQDPDAEVRVTAAELLGRLDDPGLEGALLEAAEKGSDAIHPVALAAYMHLAEGRAGKGERAAALAMYTQALDLARTDALRGAALRGLATVPSVDSLPRVEAQLKDDALVAYIAIACAIGQSGDKARAVAMLQRALQTARARDVLQASVAGLHDLGVDVDPARESGFVTTWWIIGPFPGSDIDRAWPPEEGVDLAAAIKADDHELRWAKHHTTDLTGIVNLAGMMQPNENATAYLYAEVTPDEARDVLVKIGSDDGAKCWLNGQLIDRAPEPRSLTVDQDKVESRLTAGANRLLLKVVQGGGGWECCLRITDREGKVVKCAQREE